MSSEAGFVHGTAVASVVAAGENGFGMVGVAPKVRILPILTPLSGDFVLKAATYAVSMGARVVNMSFTSTSDLGDTLAALAKAHPDVLFVAAAGNDREQDAKNIPYPCAVRAANLLCVAALQAGDRRAGFSNLNGDLVHLGAPGSAILVAQPPQYQEINLDFEHEVPLNAQGWSRTKEIWYTGDYALQASGERAHLQVEFDLRNAKSTNCSLTYDVLNRMRGADTLAVTVQGRNGTTLGSKQYAAPASFGDWQEESIRLSDSSEPGGDVRFDANLQDPQSSVGLDNVVLHCFASSYTTDTQEYDFAQGTSFASPIVAGVGALLFSAYPSLSGANAARAMLDTVQPIPALRGVTITGGTVDAAAALKRAKQLAPDKRS
jgi:subtilisin family serine protease